MSPAPSRIGRGGRFSPDPEIGIGVPGASVVWRGQNPRSRRFAEFIRLFRCSWENPHPESEVSHIDLVAERPGTSPWLVALRAE